MSLMSLGHELTENCFDSSTLDETFPLSDEALRSTISLSSLSLSTYIL